MTKLQKEMPKKVQSKQKTDPQTITIDYAKVRYEASKSMRVEQALRKLIPEAFEKRVSPGNVLCNDWAKMGGATIINLRNPHERANLWLVVRNKKNDALYLVNMLTGESTDTAYTQVGSELVIPAESNLELLKI